MASISPELLTTAAAAAGGTSAAAFARSRALNTPLERASSAALADAPTASGDVGVDTFGDEAGGGTLRREDVARGGVVMGFDLKRRGERERDYKQTDKAHDRTPALFGRGARRSVDLCSLV